MTTDNRSAVPKPFSGLRVVLVDNDTTSLLDMASKLEDYSYQVTITELAAVALSILQERKDRFDLVMADFNMPEMDCIKFINSVQLIKDFPIILMSSKLDKDTIEEARRNGACFFMKKPISIKKLKNVWQHVYRMSKITQKNITDEVSEFQEATENEEGKNADPGALHKDKHISDNEQTEDNHVDGTSSAKLTKNCNKRKRTEVEEFEAMTDSGNFCATFLKLIQGPNITKEPQIL